MKADPIMARAYISDLFGIDSIDTRNGISGLLVANEDNIISYYLDLSVNNAIKAASIRLGKDHFRYMNARKYRPYYEWQIDSNRSVALTFDGNYQTVVTLIDNGD